MTPNLKQSLKVLAGRMAGIALAAVLGALEKSGVPHDAQGALALTGVALAAVVAASPNLFAAAGILRPLAPGERTLFQQIGANGAALLSAPAARRAQAKRDLLAEVEQAAEAATLATLAKTGQFNAAQLGQKKVALQAPPRADLDLDPNRPAGGGAVFANTESD